METPPSKGNPKFALNRERKKEKSGVGMKMMKSDIFIIIIWKAQGVPQ